jgi:hypothetical protein
MPLTIIPETEMPWKDLHVVTVTFLTAEDGPNTLEIHGAVEVRAYTSRHAFHCEPHTASVHAKVVGDDWNVIFPQR